MHCYKNEYNLNRTYYEMFKSKKLDCVDRIVFTKFAIEQLHKVRYMGQINGKKWSRFSNTNRHCYIVVK